jgi:hypothetical protein
MFPRLGYARVWAKLTAGLAGIPVPCPSEKALRDLHHRLGSAPMKPQFEVVAGPLAQPRTPGACFGALRTVAATGHRRRSLGHGAQRLVGHPRARLASADPHRVAGPLPRLCHRPTTQLPAATRVLDPFHVVKLGLNRLDDVRRRVQHDTTGHRGRTGDPLYGIRWILRRRADRLSTKARVRLDTGLIAGDPDQGRTRASELITNLRGCPIPEIAKLGRTLHAWRTEATQ